MQFIEFGVNKAKAPACTYTLIFVRLVSVFNPNGMMIFYLFFTTDLGTFGLAHFSYTNFCQ